MLVQRLLDKEFIPNYLQLHFEALASVLKSGLIPLRHKRSSSHGHETKLEVPAYMAGYALHLAATNILFLVQKVESDKN